LQRPGEHDERQHRHARRLEANDLRAERGKILSCQFTSW
jgi:hypothetical protein